MERYCARRVFFRVRAVDFFGILRLVEFFFGGRDIMHRGLSVFLGIFLFLLEKSCNDHSKYVIYLKI